MLKIALLRDGETLLQAGVALLHRQVAHRIGKSLELSDENAHLPGAGDAGLDEIALEQHEVVHHLGYHHHWVLRPLGLVYRCGISKGERVQLG